MDELCVEKEKLLTYSVTIDNKDYHSTIITSLPNFLSNFASSLLTNVRLHAAMGTVDPDQLISLISKEYNHGVSQHLWCTVKCLKMDDKDEAMLTLLSWKGKKDCKPMVCAGTVERKVILRTSVLSLQKT